MSVSPLLLLLEVVASFDMRVVLVAPFCFCLTVAVVVVWRSSWVVVVMSSPLTLPTFAEERRPLPSLLSNGRVVVSSQISFLTRICPLSVLIWLLSKVLSLVMPSCGLLLRPAIVLQRRHKGDRHARDKQTHNHRTRKKKEKTNTKQNNKKTTSKIRQEKTRQDKRKQEKTRQATTAQDKTRQDKTRQDKTRHDKTRQDKTGQDKTRQDKTRQDKTRQDKTRQTRQDETS
jgi:hypothetical protein